MIRSQLTEANDKYTKRTETQSYVTRNNNEEQRAKMQYQQRQNDAAVVRRKHEQTRTLKLTIK